MDNEQLNTVCGPKRTSAHLARLLPADQQELAAAPGLSPRGPFAAGVLNHQSLLSQLLLCSCGDSSLSRTAILEEFGNVRSCMRLDLRGRIVSRVCRSRSRLTTCNLRENDSRDIANGQGTEHSVKAVVASFNVSNK